MWLRIALAAQLAFFAVWGGQLLTSHRGVDGVWLETEPVDPRDLLSGHFVALRYAIATSDAVGCAEARSAPPGTRIFVQLVPSGRTVSTAEGIVDITRPAQCRTDLPVIGPGEQWIAGEVGVGEFGEVGAHFGIERFYVPENSALRTAQSGTVVAKVAVSSSSLQGRIIDLVPIVP